MSGLVGVKILGMSGSLLSVFFKYEYIISYIHIYIHVYVYKYMQKYHVRDDDVA